MNPNEQFETIVSQYYEPLFRFAMSLTQTESDAMDLTQQTFYVWATKGHQLRDITKVKTWLFTTLHRDFLNMKRKQNRFSHQELDEVSEEIPVIAPKFAENIDSSQVMKALAKVDETYQSAVALFYLEDCPYKEIADILGVRIGTVKSRISRGIAQLRTFLLPENSGEPTSNAGKKHSSTDENEVVVALEDTSDQIGENERTEVQPDERGYQEWDYSATLLPEQHGAS